MNNDQFVRYKALDRCFRNKYGMYTKEMLIKECTLAVRTFHGDPNKKVSERTIELDLQNLKDRYSIPLAKGLKNLDNKKVYRYEDTDYSLMQVLLADGELEQMMLQNILDTLALYDDIPQYKWLYIFLQQRLNGVKTDGTSIIDFDNNQDLFGMEFFDLLANAILKKTPLLLHYKPYSGESSEKRIHPYLLKQFNKRWFLVARTEGFESLSNYAIDRIESIESLNIEYIPADIDFAEYFENVIGVTRYKEMPIEDILIRINNKRYRYIESKALHPTQTKIRELSNDEYTVIRIRVQQNFELETLILSLGCDAEVLAPESLRTSIKNKILQLNSIYK